MQGRQRTGWYGRSVASVLVAVVLGGCGTDQTGSIITPAVIQVPPEAPKVTGRSVAADVDHAKLVASFGGEYHAPALQALLADVADRLMKASDRPDETYAVTLLDSPVVNAFALPNGRLYVTRGLLALASDTSEVAAVLAHEIAHVMLRHATARTELALRSKLVSRVVADVLNDPATGAQMENQSKFTLARFSRDQELEADAMSVPTLARAGFDPYGASRFLTALGRTMALKAAAGSVGESEMLATHPGTAERIMLVTRAARRVGAPGLGQDGRARYLAALDGLAYGDDPKDGMVRSGRYIHPTLGIAFDVPDGIAIENTRNAVLGTSADGTRRLLFDQIESQDGQKLDEVLKATWNDALDTSQIESRQVNGRAAAFALSKGKDWTFRLAAIRVGSTTFRMIMAGKGSADPETAFRSWIESLASVEPDEARTLKPQRIQVVSAETSDTVASLSRRMAVTDRAQERFLLLNDLDRSATVRPGQPYKLIVD